MAPRWLIVGTLEVSYIWQTIDNPFVGGELFRVRQQFDQFPVGYCLFVSEYAAAGKYGYEKIFPTSRTDNLIHSPIPEFMQQLGFNQRRIALKASPSSRFFDLGWTITIERYELNPPLTPEEQQQQTIQQSQEAVVTTFFR